jgi:2-polyprenyl-3-methyl-5-hydroxy-6-metoxy-1,4-benzoquinol methylase
LYEQILKKKKQSKLPNLVQPKPGVVADLPPEVSFDTIIYIDVLEHIENDREELSRAIQHLREKGRLIVLSPAYPKLYSPFDKAVGHYRRYTRKTLRAAADPTLVSERKIFFLESAGLSLLLLNRYVFRNRYPGRAGIWVWQHLFIPMSIVLDRVFSYRFGKSIIGIWEKK